jgi:Holliday junction resolvase RusA-like endonuclease
VTTAAGSGIAATHVPAAGPTAASGRGELVIEVRGTPAPQGSKSYKGHRAGKPVLVESCAAVPAWREAVVTAAREAMRRAGFITMSAPSIVVIDFYLARPASAPKRRTVPDRRPDLDKLIRSTLDALTTAGVIEDDARVVEITARKHYARASPGACVVVRRA